MITRKEKEVYLSVAELATYLGLSEYLINLHKGELESALERATCAVENKNNISLRAMTLSLSLNYAEGYCSLYHFPISEIVTEGLDFDGMGVTFPTLQRTAVVEYKTTATPDADIYRIAVLAYAGKLYNDEQA